MDRVGVHLGRDAGPRLEARRGPALYGVRCDDYRGVEGVSVVHDIVPILATMVMSVTIEGDIATAASEGELPSGTVPIQR